MRPRVIRTLPHDPAAYTQGLLWAHGTLLESTGLHGRSTLRRGSGGGYGAARALASGVALRRGARAGGEHSSLPGRRARLLSGARVGLRAPRRARLPR
ncbi:MAG: glutaminyl-peptide cyclotransferase [Thermoanaerobaculia bacterium]